MVVQRCRNGEMTQVHRRGKNRTHEIQAGAKKMKETAVKSKASIGESICASRTTQATAIRHDMAQRFLWRESR